MGIARADESAPERVVRQGIAWRRDDALHARSAPAAVPASSGDFGSRDGSLARGGPAAASTGRRRRRGVLGACFVCASLGALTAAAPARAQLVPTSPLDAPALGPPPNRDVLRLAVTDAGSLSAGPTPR